MMNLPSKQFINDLPAVRIHFYFEVYNTAGQQLNDAEATLVFVNTVTKKPCQAPQNLLNQLKKYF